MRTAVVLSLILAFTPVVESMADENPYYLELGKEVNGEDAVRDWQVLSAKFPKQLGKLQFLPESFIESHSVVTRLQAGPVADKSRAEAICSVLFRKNTPCFVIEGLERPTSDQVARAINKGKAVNEAAATVPAPEQTASDAPEYKDLKLAPAVADTASAPILLAQTPPSPALQDSPTSPWPAVDEPKPMQPITDTDTESTSAAPAAPPSAKKPAPAEPAKKDDTILPWLRKDNASANVEVDEAIRVPLTTAQNDAAEKPLINPVTVPADAAPIDVKDIAKPTQVSDSAANVPGWLNVESFGTETQASGFWDAVHSAVPNLAAGLRVRIIHPLETEGQSAVALNVGPFPTRDAAMAFCRSGILAQDSSLQCQFTDHEPEGVARILTSHSDHSDRYAARRQMLMDKRQEALNSGASAADHKTYWLQVASGDSEIEALQLWEKLRTDNADVLGNVRSSVSAPLLGSSGYQVKIGPLDSNSQAVSLCKTLKSRGADCRIFSNM